MVLINLSSLSIIVHLPHHTFLQNPTPSPSFIFHPWQICHATKRNISFWLPTFTSFFLGPMYLQNENLPFPWLLQQANPKSFASYKHYYHSKINFLKLVLCSFGQHISLVMYKSCQWLTFTLKSFQQRLSCSRGFTVSARMTDLLKLYL